MKDIIATEAARKFSEVLDEVEHRNESFLVRRGGQVIARIGPASRASGADVKKILRSKRVDAGFARELGKIRAALLGMPTRSA